MDSEDRLERAFALSGKYVHALILKLKHVHPLLFALNIVSKRRSVHVQFSSRPTSPTLLHAWSVATSMIARAALH